MSEIEIWLEKHGLSKYAEAFAQHEIEVGDLSELTDDDLVTIGLPLGPRRRFSKAIREQAFHGAQPVNSALGPAIVAERRQLTVMFIDLVGSTEIAQRLDPEDLAEVLRLFKETCAAAVAVFDGHIASYYGDGIMVFFGFPHAHEDDPERAIRAGLRIIQETPEIHTHARLEVRIGIATGLVVVGDLRGENMFEDGTAMGETPNLAARLQAMADPGTLIVAPTTHQLAGDAFEYVLRGAFKLKGFAKEVEAWQVTGTRRTLSRFMAADSGPMNSLIGREHEYKTLHGKWAQASGGQGQVVLVSGEAGIGKSRLIEELRLKVGDARSGHLRFQCSPYHETSAFYPVIRQLENAADLRADDTDDVKLEKVAKTLGAPSIDTLKLAAALLSIPFEDQLGPLDLTPQQVMDQTLDMLVEHFVAEAGQRSVLFLFEDAHWIDPTTKTLLDRIVDRIPDTPVLVVMTHRTGFDAGWDTKPHVSHVRLKQLDFPQVREIVHEVAGGKPIPPEMFGVIAGRSNGVPLFVEEVTKDLLESGLLAERANAVTLSSASNPAPSVPSTLHDALMARLDRLSSAKEVAQIGAVIGPHFTYPLISSVSGFGNKALRAGLDLLVDAGIVTVAESEPEETFVYRHALIRDTAYNSLLKSERRSLHARVAKALDHETSNNADTGPEVLAHHYTMAKMTAEAIEQWHLAGQRAAERSANVEAVTQLGNAIKQLSELKKTAERDRKEVEIQVLRAGVLRSTAGIAADETGAAYARIRKLCNRLDETENLFPVLNGLYAFHLVRAEYDLAKEVAEQILELASQSDETHHVMIAHRAMGAVLLHIGDLDAAHEHLEQALELYDPGQHGSLAYVYGSDHAAITSCFLSIAVWLMGEPDRALEIQRTAVTAAQGLKHAHSIAQTLTYLSMLHILRREPDEVLEVVQQLEELSDKHSFTFMTVTANFWRSWATAYNSPTPETIHALRQAADAWWNSGAGNYKPFFLTLIAELTLKIGDPQGAQSILAEARHYQKLTNEGWAQAQMEQVHALSLQLEAP
ncbi:adenylate/guanylate cyclase domain-containing protein [Ruegeria sp. Ofav3-42]|uniref:AAA family ATPase n=1 Tax=Ruegeria sp. Ofav3-42 TaxID=2917759 RepID=UPI001EF5A72D|nr:adenylate/guanylate cyclase domain-containing protein [Ruegeria sp. Ofav3-42]MCG7519789.1 AAA family ATPase [Ruegeria sp. Ofav3-42]